MHSSPLLTVLVTAHNQEKYLGRCLRSLLSQTLDHHLYEVLVVDDASTDRTPYALELFHDAIRTIHIERNVGLAAAANRGIREARGEYIVRVDGDDYVSKHFLEMLFVCLDQNDGMDAVACDYMLIDDEEQVIGRGCCLNEPIACGILFRREQLLQLGLYDEAFRTHEDRELRMRFDRRHRVFHLPVPLYRYRRHTANMTNDHDVMAHYLDLLHDKHGVGTT